MTVKLKSSRRFVSSSSNHSYKSTGPTAANSTTEDRQTTRRGTPNQTQYPASRPGWTRTRSSWHLLLDQEPRLPRSAGPVCRSWVRPVSVSVLQRGRGGGDDEWWSGAGGCSRYLNIYSAPTLHHPLSLQTRTQGDHGSSVHAPRCSTHGLGAELTTDRL